MVPSWESDLRSGSWHRSPPQVSSCSVTHDQGTDERKGVPINEGEHAESNRQQGGCGVLPGRLQSQKRCPACGSDRTGWGRLFIHGNGERDPVAGSCQTTLVIVVAATPQCFRHKEKQILSREVCALAIPQHFCTVHSKYGQMVGQPPCCEGVQAASGHTGPTQPQEIGSHTCP